MTAAAVVAPPLLSAGARSWCGERRALSLMYHDIVEHGAADASGFPGATAARYKLDRRAFEAHLGRIAGAVPRPRRTVLDPSGGSAVFLTFDDGGQGARLAADVLERAGWRGHFFITTGRLGTRGFLTRGQVRELRARGHVVGTHTHSHPARLHALARERILEEWTRSIAILADLLGEPVVTGSVPGGSYSPRVADGARRAGARILFTSEPVARVGLVQGCLVFGRYAVTAGTTPGAAAGIARGEHLPRITRWIGWNARKVAKAAAGNAYLDVRRRLIRRPGD